LTPFVGRDVYPHDTLYIDADSRPANPRNIDGLQYLKMWKFRTPNEYDYYLNLEEQQAPVKQEADNDEAERVQVATQQSSK